ncbi:MAG: hypothetical protein WCG25_03515 [bacterium]
MVRKLCPYCAAKIEATYGEKEEISQSVKRINEANPSMNLKFD